MNSTVGASLDGGVVWMAPAHLVAALACALALPALLYALRPSGGDLAKLPGPRGVPVLGNLLQVAVPNTHHVFRQWADDFGPVLKFYLLNRPHLLVSDPSLLLPLLNRGPDETPKAFNMIYSVFDEITGGPSIFTMAREDEWRVVRKGCAPAFSPDNIRKAFPAVKRVVQELCDALAPLAAAGSVDMDEAAMRITLDVIGMSGYGHDFGARKMEDCPVFETLPLLLEQFSAAITNPLLRLMYDAMPFLPAVKLYRSKLRDARAIWALLLSKVRALDLAASPEDTTLRACLARLQDPVTGEPFSDKQLIPNIGTFLIGGFETTAHSIAWTLYELAIHPEVQAKLAAELDSAGLLAKPGSTPRELEYADLSQLSYLNWVWKEGMRRHPVAGASIRETDREINIGGLRIPKGVTIWASIWPVTLSRFNFTEPMAFWPERWAQEVPAPNGGKDNHPTPVGNSANPVKSFLPFSDGPRNCIGQNLAQMEGRAAVAMLCSRFEFAVAPEMGSPQEVYGAEVFKLTMQCSKGIRLLLTPRGHGGA